MVTANYITLANLEAALEKALKPVIDRLDDVDKRLDRIECNLKHVRGRTNQIYDALEKHGLPMPTPPKTNDDTLETGRVDTGTSTVIKPDF